MPKGFLRRIKRTRAPLFIRAQEFVRLQVIDPAISDGDPSLMTRTPLLALAIAASHLGIAAHAATGTASVPAAAKSPPHPVLYCKKGHPKAVVKERTEDGDNVHFVLVAAKGGQQVADFTASKDE